MNGNTGWEAVPGTQDSAGHWHGVIAPDSESPFGEEVCEHWHATPASARECAIAWARQRNTSQAN